VIEWLIRFIIHFGTARDYTSQSSLPLPGSGFDGGRFYFLWVPELYPCLNYQFLTATSSQRLNRSSSLTNYNLKSKLCYDRRRVGHSLLVSSHQLGPKIRFLLLSDVAGLLMWRAHSDEGTSLSFTVATGLRQRPSPAGLMIIFYCLRFETSPAWMARSPSLYPPGTGWPSCTPRHWVPFSSPSTTHRATVDVFEPVSTRG
jgi:hypothetical protein